MDLKHGLLLWEKSTCYNCSKNKDLEEYLIQRNMKEMSSLYCCLSELCDLCRSPSIVTIANCKRLQGAKHVT